MAGTSYCRCKRRANGSVAVDCSQPRGAPNPLALLPP
jgi:hypothetical protein